MLQKLENAKSTPKININPEIQTRSNSFMTTPLSHILFRTNYRPPMTLAVPVPSLIKGGGCHYIHLRYGTVSLNINSPPMTRCLPEARSLPPHPLAG